MPTSNKYRRYLYIPPLKTKLSSNTSKVRALGFNLQKEGKTAQAVKNTPMKAHVCPWPLWLDVVYSTMLQDDGTTVAALTDTLVAHVALTCFVRQKYPPLATYKPAAPPPENNQNKWATEPFVHWRPSFSVEATDCPSQVSGGRRYVPFTYDAMM